MLCLLGHLGRSGAGRAGNGSGRGRTGRGAGRYRRAFRRQPGADRPCVAALRSDMQDLFAQLERQLGEGDVVAAPRPCIPSRAARFHRWRQRPAAVPASWSRPCAAPITARWYGNPRRHPPRRTAHPVRCLPAPPAGDRSATCRRSRRAEPRRGGQSAKDSGGPGGSPASAAACRANNAMGVIRRYSRPGLERHPLPVVQYLQASRSRSWALSRA